MNDQEAFPEGSPPVVGPMAYGISLGGDRTDATLRAVEIFDPKIQWSLGHSLDATTARQIVKGNYSIVLISSLPNNPWELIEAFARRLRKAGFNGWIAVGNWRVKTIDSSVRRRLKEAGVDYTSHRLHAVCRIISYATASLFDTAEPTEPSTAMVREIELVTDRASEEKNSLGGLATVVP